MDPPPKPSTPSSTSLFQVYLRLKPPTTSTAHPAQLLTSLYPSLPTFDRYLTVEAPAAEEAAPTYITIYPPNDTRRRAVEKFAFTRVFQEDAEQLDIFRGTGVMGLIEGVLGDSKRGKGRDGLLATLGVTGSGKSHTILGSRTQRGMTQMSLDVLFRTLNDRLVRSSRDADLLQSVSTADASEAQLFSAANFLGDLYGDSHTERASSRAPTPMMVGNESSHSLFPPSIGLYPSLLGLNTGSSSPQARDQRTPNSPILKLTRSLAKSYATSKDGSTTPSASSRHRLQRPSTLPQIPAVEDVPKTTDTDAEYAIIISMYEVYNDRIFDLLTCSSSTGAPSTTSKIGAFKDHLRRRPLLFKSTEKSPDRKVVAGLRKVVCDDLNQALMVLETGLHERRVAGTGSNSVSSRSHGFFCVEVKKRAAGKDNRRSGDWSGSTLTVVDLAGSERARNAKTAGATLAEAGKINESLMYLGQCLQMQSDSHEGNRPALVPFRQCKLTELLFSNSFPSSSSSHQHPSSHRNPQKAVMIVTADPLGDFNATSQILRYSALARDVTVPRIPSITSTILSGTTAKGHPGSGRTTPSSVTAEELEQAAQELLRLSEEVDVLHFKLAEEENRRRDAEAAWKAAEERCIAVEQEVREECGADMERRIEEERRRWKGAWCEEADRNDQHMDKKLEILTQAIPIYEDPPLTESTRIAELEDDNAALQRRIDLLEREMHSRSPTKAAKTKRILTPARPLRAFSGSNNSTAASPSAETMHVNEAVEQTISVMSRMTLKENEMTGGGTEGMDVMRSARKENQMFVLEASEAKPPKTPGTAARKMRKLTTRKWDLGPEEMITP
ncbi:MAG: hypothetical protein M1817_005824 [Caeruleum heppii]|nr:MAG: hypothetical protein M1817_005824 [Caeruleum heppii]